MTVTCYRCAVPIPMPVDTETTLRQSGVNFYCLWGHQQHFPAGETEAEKLRRERDRLKQENARLADESRIAWNSATKAREDAKRGIAAARGQVTRLKNRAAAGLCPCCNRSFVNLHRHMQTKHAGFEVSAPAEEVSA